MSLLSHETRDLTTVVTCGYDDDVLTSHHTRGPRIHSQVKPKWIHSVLHNLLQNFHRVEIILVLPKLSTAAQPLPVTYGKGNIEDSANANIYLFRLYLIV